MSKGNSHTAVSHGPMWDEHSRDHEPIFRRFRAQDSERPSLIQHGVKASNFAELER